MTFPKEYPEDLPNDHPDSKFAAFPKYAGLNKGAKIICIERFGIFSVYNKTFGDLKNMLLMEEDFNSSVYLIEEEMARRDPPVMVDFFPKFHCMYFIYFSFHATHKYKCLYS